MFSEVILFHCVSVLKSSLVLRLVCCKDGYGSFVFISQRTIDYSSIKTSAPLAILNAVIGTSLLIELS